MSQSQNPYDEVPDESRAVPLAHPERMSVAALRAGLAPRDPSQASVLELGCAEGGNLVPMAYHLADARFVGVGGSAAHIEAASFARDRLGLDNLTVRPADFRALRDEHLGEFDYVIMHGVLSWVDAEVRALLLELVRRHLAPEGVAFLSYNCAAGWALEGELRHLLLRHTTACSSTAERVTAARELLTLLATSPLRDGSLHAAALAERAQDALENRDAYLVHECLAPENQAYRQPELRALAQQHGLAFVTGLAAATNRPDLEEELERGLSARHEDPAEAADLLDAMLGRAFRASLFCRADAERRPLEPLALAGACALRGALRPEAKRPSLDPDVSESFVASSGARVAVRSAALKAALLELGRAWPGAIPFDALVERARSRPCAPTRS